MKTAGKCRATTFESTISPSQTPPHETQTALKADEKHHVAPRKNEVLPAPHFLADIRGL
jgi:hypothetical protein